LTGQVCQVLEHIG